MSRIHDVNMPFATNDTIPMDSNMEHDTGRSVSRPPDEEERLQDNQASSGPHGSAGKKSVRGDTRCGAILLSFQNNNDQMQA